MSFRFDLSGAGMVGRNVFALTETPTEGVGESSSSEIATLPPGMPERNTLSLRERVEHSGGPGGGHPECFPEHSGPTIPALPGAGRSRVRGAVHVVGPGPIRIEDFEPPAPGVVAVYSDGGLIRSNPSPIGGMWAWCHVDADDWRVREESGILEPSDVEGRDVTNHHTETYALLMALEALPDGWTGRACSDSRNALRVFFGEGSLRNLPAAWRPRIGAVLRRLGRIEPIRLDGHPTRAQLAAGIGKRGAPVSEHNVRVDDLCTKAGERFMLARTAVRA